MVKFEKMWIKKAALSGLAHDFKVSFDKCVNDTMEISTAGFNEYTDDKTRKYVKDTATMCEIYGALTEMMCKELELQTKKLDELQKQVLELNEKLNK